MQSEALMLYKLIILYILNRVDFPITNGQLTNFILEKDYTNYFTIQQTISDLLEDDYIKSDTAGNNSLYKITEAGKETLSFFYNSISVAIRDDIDIYLEEHEYALRQETSTPAEYFAEKKDEYIARLRVIERESIVIDLSLSLATEEEAELVCRQWKKKSSDIYGYIMASLFAED